MEQAKPVHGAILVTSSGEGARRLVEELRAGGFRPRHAPLFVVEEVPLPPLVSMEDGALVLTTSAHAVRALAQATEARGMALCVVGDASERAAKEMGFTRVTNCRRETGGEGARGMLEYIAGAVPLGEAGRFYYLSGEEVHTDLAAVLRERGYRAERHVVYRMAPVEAFSDEVLALWEEIGAVTLMSRRAARHFLALAERHGKRVHHMAACCLSGAIAEEVCGAGFADAPVAEEAGTDALLRAVKEYSFSGSSE